MAAELDNLKRWCWERERESLKSSECETLDTSILKLSSAYRGEDSGVCCRGFVERRIKITWRLSSRRRWVTSVETRSGRESRQRSNCTTTLVKWSDCGDLLEVKSGTTAIAGGVVSSIELFSYAERPGVVGGQRTSANRDKLFDSRPAVLSPFIACRTVSALVLLCILLFFHIHRFVFIYQTVISIFPHYITGYSLTTRQPSRGCGTSFRRLKRWMVAVSQLRCSYLVVSELPVKQWGDIEMTV